jgi:ribonuclease HI
MDDLLNDLFLDGSYKNITVAPIPDEPKPVVPEKIKKPNEVDLFTDSRYVIDSITKNWVYNWKAKGWKRSNGEKALNIDLWEQLLPLLEIHTVNFNWVKGHAGNIENERCDELARKAAENPTEEDI